MKKIINTICEAIGQTPLLDLNRLTSAYNLDGHIYAKLEYLSPGFSKKDRIALYIIEEAERTGALKPGQPVLESTSGNTGTGLAIVCQAKGYPFIAVMSKGNSMERVVMMEALGAEVILVDQAPESSKGLISGKDLALVIEATEEIIHQRGAFHANQFGSESNTYAHEHSTAVEILDQTQGEFQFFVDFLGTGGTFEGCAKAIKSYDPSIQCYAVEPKHATFYCSDTPVIANHKIQGGGYSMDLPLIHREYMDGCIGISDEEAIEYTRALAKYEGAFCGFSSGANVAAAVKLLKEHPGSSVVILLNDSGLKYLSTDLFA